MNNAHLPSQAYESRHGVVAKGGFHFAPLATPAIPPVPTASFSRDGMPTDLWNIPARTLLSVACADDPGRQWKPHRTRIPLRLQEFRTPEIHGSSGAIIFSHAGYLILTRRSNIRRTR